MKLFTIITVCYNSEKDIEKTMRSVLEQEFTDFEYILVDGKSSDNTIGIAAQLLDRFIIKGISLRIYSDTDNGIYNAMNKGISYSDGRYILFLNSGDYLFGKDTLYKTGLFLEKQIEEPDAFYGNYCNYYNGRLYFMDSRDIECVTTGMPACHQSIFVKTDILKKYGFNENYRLAADYDLMLKLYKENRTFLKMDTIVSVYCIGGISSTNTMRAFQEYEQIKYTYGEKKYKHYNVIKYLYNILKQELTKWNRYYEYELEKGAKKVFVIGESQIQNE